MDYRVLPHTDAVEKLENFITVNRISPNARIPSERDLCKMWGLNRTTLHFAVNTLVEQGRLYRIKGTGTYVAEAKQVRNIVGVLRPAKEALSHPQTHGTSCRVRFRGVWDQARFRSGRSREDLRCSE